jgi:peptide/nickel transport system permease protein
MHLMDIMLAFPSLLLAIALIAILGKGLRSAMLAIGIVSIPVYARLARSMAIGLRNEDFVIASRSVGASQAYVLRYHIFPNSLAPIIVQATLGMGIAVVETAALGFLGLGQQAPYPELGKMLADSQEFLVYGKWWGMVFPGLAITLVVLGFNLLGDGLRDTLDPKLRGRS